MSWRSATLRRRTSLSGSYYLARFDQRRAIKEFSWTLEQDPKFPDGHAQLAYAYFFDAQWDLSVKMCEEELALDHDDDNAVKLVGTLYGQRAGWMKRRLSSTRQRAGTPTTAKFFIRSVSSTSRRMTTRAVTVLEEVIRLHPDFPQAHITIVRAYGKLKRPDDVKREQAIVDRLNAERKNRPTVRDKALYDAFKPPG